MIVARKHRGHLDDSVDTMRVFDTVEEMKQWFADSCNIPQLKGNLGCTPDDIVIDDEVRYDERINWNTRYICTKKYADMDIMKLYSTPQCVGMCDLNYEPKCNPMDVCSDYGSKECAICCTKNDMRKALRED